MPHQAFHSRVDAIAASATVALSEKARLLKQGGADVISLAAGEPDFPTPDHITRAACRAMEAGQTHYVSARGIPALLAALSDHYQTRHGIAYDPDTEILVTTGGKMAIYAAVLATVQPGEAVLIPEPAWVSYVPIVQLAGAVPLPVPLDGAAGFPLDRDRLTARLTPGTRALLINSPNNPTGRVLTRTERETIAEIAHQCDLTVISDEIYDRLLYDDHRHVTVAGLPGMRERTVVVNGFSKSYAMTGWRLGTVAAPRHLLSRILKVQQHTITCAASFSQQGAVAALTGSQTCVDEMLAAYARRRDILITGLNRLPGITCRRPEGAFYAFADIRGTGDSADGFAQRMLERAGVVVTPGSAFGASGEGYVRISFACADKELERAIDRMARGLAG